MKIGKKLLAVILSALLFISICPACVFTFVANAQDYSGGCGANLTWEYDPTVHTLTVSGTGEMENYDIAEVDGNNITTAPWQAYCREITSVVIEPGVEKVGNLAFLGCSAIMAVTIPETVTYIGHGAFANCTQLQSIVIPNSVSYIDAYPFFGCGALESITVSAGNLAYRSTGNCLIAMENKTLISGCKNSIIPDDGSVTSIGEYAFSGCFGLTAITLPGSITDIEEGAFTNCTGLTSVTVPAKVTAISEYAFSGCKNLSSIVIPESVTTILNRAFVGCSRLENIYYCGSAEQKNAIKIGDNNNALNLANWHYNYGKYTVTYVLNGGTNNKSNPAVYTKETATITLKNPTKSGYAFLGWYKESSFKNKVSSILKGLAGNITLYAKWEKVYTITYKLNGGTNNSSNPKSYRSSSAAITLKNPTRKGYTFKGWFSDSRLKNKITKIAKGSSGNKNIYAKWAKTYKITYKLNGGKNNSKNPKTYTKIDATIILKSPTRKGYVFKGWYKDARFRKKITQIKKGSWKDKTLYAKWAKKK